MAQQPDATPLGAEDSVRASHGDREHVMGLLQEAYAQGRITVDEFGDRTDRAGAAKTVGDLRPLVADLPAAQPTATPVPSGGDVVQWKGTFGSLKRSGPWVVPAKIILHRRMGSVELDFTEARFSTPVVEIELDVIGGSIEIRVPEGAEVNTDAVDVVLGSVEDHRKNATGGGRPLIRFAGTLRAGSLETRGPKRKLFG
jgi:hypothetical protein